MNQIQTKAESHVSDRNTPSFPGLEVQRLAELCFVFPPEQRTSAKQLLQAGGFFFGGGVGGFGRWFCVVFCLFGCFLCDVVLVCWYGFCFFWRCVGCFLGVYF